MVRILATVALLVFAFACAAVVIVAYVPLPD